MHLSILNIEIFNDSRLVQKENIFFILSTLLVSKLIFKLIKFLHLLNIFDISLTFSELNLIKSIDCKDSHPSNKYDIFSTLYVFISPKLINCKEEHSLNIEDISLLFLKLKFDISKLFKFLQP